MFASKELAKDIRINEIWNENEMIKKQINSNIQLMLKSNQKTEEIKQDKLIHVSQSEKTILQLKHEFTEKMNTLRIKTEVASSKLYKDSIDSKNNLTEGVTAVSNEYDAILMNDEEISKKLLETKYKRESNLINWIQKYDTDIGSKQLVLDDLMDELYCATNSYNEYQNMISDQETVYYEVLELKRLEAIENLIMRTRHRSAKKIQIWFKKEMKRIRKKRKKAAKKAKKLKVK